MTEKLTEKLERVLMAVRSPLADVESIAVEDVEDGHVHRAWHAAKKARVQVEEAIHQVLPQLSATIDALTAEVQESKSGEDLLRRARDNYDELRREAVGEMGHWKARAELAEAEVQAKEQEIARLTTLAELGRDSRQMLPLVIEELATLKARTCETCALKVEAMSASKLGLIVCSRTDRMEDRAFSCAAHTPKEPAK